jgi:hypothetical protein
MIAVALDVLDAILSTEAADSCLLSSTTLPPGNELALPRAAKPNDTTSLGVFLLQRLNKSAYATVFVDPLIPFRMSF